jgi:hypothetical protein
MLDVFSSKRWKWSEEPTTQVVHSGGQHEKVYLLEKLKLKRAIIDWRDQTMTFSKT